MLALISPAKKLDTDTNRDFLNTTTPSLLDEAQALAEQLKTFSQNDLSQLMNVSDKLAALNHQRYQEFSTPFTKDNAQPALAVFRGDTYVGLDVDTLSEDEVSYAQNHLGILSGLYGFLRPLDLMQAYRLEMGTSLSNARGKNLYEFWGNLITKACNDTVKDHEDKTIISLASNEYIHAVQPEDFDGDFITCHFKEIKNGQPKTIGLFAKRARGMMARFMIQNCIETPEGLKDFDSDGYSFAAELSNQHEFVFTRV